MSDWETTGNVFDDGDWETVPGNSVTAKLPPATPATPAQEKRDRARRFRQSTSEMAVAAADQYRDETDPEIAREVDRLTQRQARPTKRSRGERFADSAREMAIHSPLGLESIYRVGLLAKGWDNDKINKLERQISDYYASRREQDPNDDWVDTGIDLAGGAFGSLDPTMVIAPGRGLVTKSFSQGGINAGVDAVGQGIEMLRGVRDEYSPLQTGVNAAAGAGLTAVGHGVGKGVDAYRRHKGERMPGWQEVNDVIVRDLEGGGTLRNPKVSPKGAMGPQQVMPETARDPGFGIRPWNGKTQEDLARVGRQYSAAMMNKYRGDVEKVLAAYNAGPGRVDALIKEHGPNWKNYLPDETKAYVAKGTEKLGVGPREGVPPMDPEMMARAMGDPEAGVKLDEDTLDAPGLRSTQEELNADYSRNYDDYAAGNITREEYESRAANIRAKVDNAELNRRQNLTDEEAAAEIRAEAEAEGITSRQLTTEEENMLLDRDAVIRGDAESIDEARMAREAAEQAPPDELQLRRHRRDQEAMKRRMLDIDIERADEAWGWLQQNYNDLEIPEIHALQKRAMEMERQADLAARQTAEKYPEMSAQFAKTRDLWSQVRQQFEPRDVARNIHYGPVEYAPWDIANDLGDVPPPRGPDGPQGPDDPGGTPPRGPEGGDPSEWAQSVNLNRLSIGEQAKNHLRSLAERAPSQTVETHPETIAHANRLIDEHGVDGVLEMDDVRVEDLPGYSVAVRSILEAASENVVKSAEAILDPKRATPLLSHKFEHSLLLAGAAFEKANRNANVAGRLLQAFRIMTQKSDTGAFAAVRREMGADATVYDIAKKIMENQAKAAQIAADGLQPGAADKFASLWYNWKLSGLTTQAANLIGTMAHISLDMMARTVGVGLGAARKGPDKASMGEIWARTIGLYSGLKQAFRSVELDDGSFTRPVSEAWKLGMPLDFVNKTRTGRAFYGPASQYLETPTRGMAVIDEIFRNIAVVSEMNGAAYRRALAEGHEGDAFKNRVLQLIETPTREMERDALEYGKRMRFADDASMLTKRLEQARRTSPDDRMGDKAMALFSKMVVPFMHTLDRLTAASISHSPLGFVNRRNQMDLQKGGAALDVANGRMIVGTALVAYAAMKAFSGDMTGAESEDIREIEANRAEGKGPYNVRIGDRWASIRTLQPVSTILGATATLVENYKKSQDAGAEPPSFFHLARRMGDAVLSGAWTESLHNFFGGSKSSPESRWANWAAGAFDPVPSIARQAWQTFGDRQERDTTGDRTFEDRVLSRWQAGTPLSTELPQKHDIYGRPLNRGDSIGPDIASPLRAQKVDEDAVVREIATLNKASGKVVIGRVQREKGMSSEEFQTIQKATGEEFMSRMSEVITGEGWETLPLEGRIKLAKKIWSEAHKIGKGVNEANWTSPGAEGDWGPDSDWVTETPGEWQ